MVLREPRRSHQQPGRSQCQHRGDGVGAGGRRRSMKSEDHVCTGLEAGEGPAGLKASATFVCPHCKCLLGTGGKGSGPG